MTDAVCVARIEVRSELFEPDCNILFGTIGRVGGWS